MRRGLRRGGGVVTEHWMTFECKGVSEKSEQSMQWVFSLCGYLELMKHQAGWPNFGQNSNLGTQTYGFCMPQRAWVMGYGYKFTTYQLGKWKNVWEMREYGL
jgi:hypothetical protein